MLISTCCLVSDMARAQEADGVQGIDMQQSPPAVASSEAAGSQGGGSSEVNEGKGHQESLLAANKFHPVPCPALVSSSLALF